MGPFPRAWNPSRTRLEGAVQAAVRGCAGGPQVGKGESAGLWVVSAQVWEEIGPSLRGRDVGAGGSGPSLPLPAVRPCGASVGGARELASEPGLSWVPGELVAPWASLWSH